MKLLKTSAKFDVFAFFQPTAEAVLAVGTGRIQFGTRAGCQTNFDDSMDIKRAPIGRMALMFSIWPMIE